VLTDYQLQAALHFLDSLAGLIQKATDLTRKKKAARKLEVKYFRNVTKWRKMICYYHETLVFNYRVLSIGTLSNLLSLI